MCMRGCLFFTGWGSILPASALASPPTASSLQGREGRGRRGLDLGLRPPCLAFACVCVESLLVLSDTAEVCVC